MDTVTISRFKATCLALLDRVMRSGRPLLVTRNGIPIAQVLPPPAPARPETWLGSFRDSGTIAGDIVSSALDEDEWEVPR